jgi:very-short-patch-repair endonuclease
LEGDPSDVVRQRLENLRKRLLDLSYRNVLLNTKFGGRGTNIIRCVDEVPNQLYENLSSQRPLVFEPLPPIEADPGDEYSPFFIQALSEAQEEDEQFKSEMLRADVADEDKIDELRAIAQRSLKDRIRAQWDMPPRPSRQDSKTWPEWAKMNRINPSFELPVEAEDGNKGHRDKKVQLLMPPEPLKATMTKLVSNVRTYKEERGVDVGMVAFGYLDYYDSDKDRQALAPLLLMRANFSQVSKTQEKGSYQYDVDGAGELEVNPVLVEKFKQFRFQIPDLEDLDTPEDYWAKLETILRRVKPEWKIRRYVAFGAMPFKGVEVYQDLALSDEEIESHERFYEMISTTVKDHMVQTSWQMPEMDTKEFDSSYPELPLDADSSQHQVILRVLDGHNLAVQGPPGSGKSQTITNMIAALASTGKKVLFVAEKAAALSVVTSRLRSIGLEDAIMDLESMGKNSVVAAKQIKTALLKGVPQKEINLEDTQAQRRSYREMLKEYYSILQEIYGSTGKRVFDVLWEYRKYPMDLDFTSLKISEPWSIDQRKEENDIETLKNLYRLEKATESIPEKSMARNFKIESISSVVLQPFEHVLDQNIERLNALNQDDAYRSITVGHIKNQKELFSKELKDTESIVNPLDGLEKTIFHAWRKQIDQIRMWISYRNLQEKLLGRMIPEEELEFFKIICSEIKELPTSFSQLKTDLSNSKTRIQNFQNNLKVLGPSLKATGLGGMLDQQAFDEKSFKAVIELIPYRKHLTEGVKEPGASNIIEKMNTDKESLLKQNAALNSSVHIDHEFKAKELKEILEIQEEDRWWKFLSGSVRKNRKTIKTKILKSPLEREECIKKLRALVTYQKDIETFNENKDFVKIGGQTLGGISTPTEELHMAHVAYRAFRTRLRMSDAFLAILEAGKSEEEILNHFAEDYEILQDVLKEFESVECTHLNQVGTVFQKNHDALNQGLDWIVDRGLEGLNPQEIKELKLTSEINAEIISDLNAFKEKGEACELTRRSTDQSENADLESFLQLIEVFNHLLESKFPIGDIIKSSTVLDLRNRCEASFNTWKEIIEGIEGQVSSLGLTKATLLGDKPSEFSAERMQEGFGELKSFLPLVPDVVERWNFMTEFSNVPILKYFTSMIEKSDLDEEILEKGWLGVLRFSQASAIYKNDRYKKFSTSFKKHQLDHFTSESIRLDNMCKRAAAIEASVTLSPATKSLPDGFSGTRVGDKTEMSLIDHLAGLKNRSSIKMKDFLHKTSGTRTLIQPITILAPHNVPKYFSKEHKFDVLIIDEASQMRVETSLSALIRTNQVVIVGDTKQLPPTSFFQVGGGSIDDEEIEAGEAVAEESILDKATSLYKPETMLQWHYRSQHTSLINFSNHHFYDGRLRIFPSAYEDHDEYGVCYHKVDSDYHSGRNPAEVSKVVDLCLEHFRSRPNDSLLVCAINKDQATLIQNALEQTIPQHQSAVDYKNFWDSKEKGLERFTVKNLENVQGDERDVIIISTVYGAEEGSNRVLQRFGPINMAGGERRLNVLFTRSKKQIHLVTSLTEADVLLHENSGLGAKTLKAYLEYAATGRLETGAIHEHHEAESVFEEQVIDMVQSMGLEAVPQVGVAGYRIDIGVKHPDYRHGFLLGIECDGARFHSSVSARDRDRLRQEILESKGWNIHRIWSTNWFDDPSKERESLKEKIEALLAAHSLDADDFEQSDTMIYEDDEPEVEELKSHVPDEPEEPSPSVSHDSFARVGSIQGKTDGDGVVFSDYHYVEAIESDDPREAAQGHIRKTLREIVKVEGPLLVSRAYKILLRSCGIKRQGRELAEILNKALAKEIKSGIIVLSAEEGEKGYQNNVIRLAEQPEVCLRIRAERTLQEIPLAELAELFRQKIDADPTLKALGGEELKRFMLSCHGITRLTTVATDRLNKALILAVKGIEEEPVEAEETKPSEPPKGPLSESYDISKVGYDAGFLILHHNEKKVFFIDEAKNLNKYISYFIRELDRGDFIPESVQEAYDETQSRGWDIAITLSDDISDVKKSEVEKDWLFKGMVSIDG